MKRLLCLLLVLSLLLVGCGQKTAEVEPTEAPTAAPTEAPTNAPTEPPTEPPTEEPTEAPTEPLPMVNPLTGEPLDAYYTGRPSAISLNNISAALPQYGLDDVDWMFEMETEGGITRCFCIMTDPSTADVVGPIRSCRTYFLNLSLSYNAPVFHCGASHFTNAGMYSADETIDPSTWEHVDQMSNGPKYFYRDSRGGGYATEHTLFTTGERMVNAMAELGLNPTDNTPVDYGYQFADTVKLNGEPAPEIDVRFRGSKLTTLELNEETGLYEARQYGHDWIDATTGETIAFRNVLTLFADQSTHANQTSSFYVLSGSGDGFFAVDGEYVPIKWFHDGISGPFRFTLADGTTPITLGVGTTYCAIADTSGSFTIDLD